MIKVRHAAALTCPQWGQPCKILRNNSSFHGKRRHFHALFVPVSGHVPALAASGRLSCRGCRFTLQGDIRVLFLKCIVIVFDCAGALREVCDGCEENAAIAGTLRAINLRAAKTNCFTCRRRRGSCGRVDQGGAASSSNSNAGARGHIVPLGRDGLQQGASTANGCRCAE
jgi:hypothetical protein